MVNYRLLALDLDDTVLTKSKEISDENKKWIAKAEEAGVVVIFATGRGKERVEHIRQELDLETPMVLANGAEVWKGPDVLLERHTIEREDIRYLYDIAKKHGARFWGYHNEKLIRGRDWTEDTFDLDFVKFGMKHQDKEVLEQIRKKLHAHQSVKVTQSAETNIEISQQGVSKESGVRKVCEHLGLEMKDVMAVGDNLNDMELIQKAGLGVAMGNGEDSLKKVADEVTTTNEKSGVAQAIKKYLFEDHTKQKMLVHA